MTTYAVTLYTNSSVASATATVPHRLSVITFKEMTEKKDGKPVLNADGTEKKKPKHANRCVSVPFTRIMIQPDSIAAALQDKFNDLQDDVIKEIIVTALDAGTTNADGTAKTILISDEQISLEACAKFHATRNTGKLSKDVLTKWFDAELLEAITIKFAKQMKLPAEPTEQQAAAIDKGIAEYRSMFAGLAAPKATLPEAIAKQAQLALKLAPESRIKSALSEKLVTILQPKEVTLSLGFIDDDEEQEEQEEQQDGNNNDLDMTGKQQQEANA